MNVFELFATLGLDSSSYEEGLDSAESKGKSFGSSIGTVVATGAKIGTAAIAATGAAAVGASVAFVKGVSDVASYGDHIDKLSQQMGISAEAYQEWDAIMQHSGTSIDTMKASMKTLANAVENGNEAFGRLGITEEEIASMNQEDLFAATIAGLQNVEDTTERTYLAGQLLGRGATELGALLNMSAEETEAMRQQVHDLGGVMSDDAVKSAAQFQDSLQDMQTAVRGVKNNLMSEFLPSFSTIMDGLSAVFSGDSNSGLAMVENGINTLASKLTKVAPEFVKVGGAIITSLASAITQNLPIFLESGAEVLSTLVEGVLDNADKIIEAVEKVINVFVTKLVDPEKAAKFTQAAVDIIVKLSNGITEALPQLLPAIVEVITAIVTTLTAPDNLSALIQCSLQLMIALANGIVDALPELVSVIPTVIFNLVEAIIDNFPEILNTTLYLIGALGYAILKALGSLLGQTLWELTEGFADMFSKAKDFGSKIGSWLRDKIQSGKNAVQNFFSSIGNFFTNGFNNIKTKVDNGLNNIKNKFTTIFDNAKNIVKNAIDYIKGLFNFQWSLPKLKLPHFKISGQLDLFATPPQIPSVSVEWYKKAMNQPYLLDSATIFGAAGGRLLGGGESGSELVIGTNKLMSMMKEAIGVGGRPININIYGAQGQDIRLLAKEVSKELQNLINDKEKVYA